MPADPLSLDELLDQRWLALAARLGERRAALLASVAERITQRGFAPGAEAARFANLCLALGPGFENKPDHEGALAILIDERLEPWVRLHQLVHQTAAALRRRGGESEAQAERLLGNDQWLLDRFEPSPPPRPRLGTQALPAMLGDDDDTTLISPPPSQEVVSSRLRRVACDTEAIELRVVDGAWRREYQRGDGSWGRVEVGEAGPLRIGVGHTAPANAHLLCNTTADPQGLRLQLRLAPHGRCGFGLHPLARWIAGGSETRWADPEVRMVAFAVSVPPPVPPRRLLAELPPSIGVLEVPTCALRDQGVPLGALRLPVFCYPAWQWLLAMERQAPLGYELPASGSAPPAAAPTRIRFERDGQPETADVWCQAFDTGLREALGAGLQRLHEAWQHSLRDARVRAEFGLFDGRATLTWGWREGARGLASPPLLRVVGDLDLLARGELHLQGLLEAAGAKCWLHLRCQGQAQLATLPERLQAEVPLADLMQSLVLRWRWPLAAEFDPIVEPGGHLFAEVGPLSGALVGSMGLRPSPRQGGAWEWFVTLALEPVGARLVTHDPLLGRSETHVALLPTLQILDWSLA